MRTPLVTAPGLDTPRTGSRAAVSWPRVGRIILRVSALASLLTGMVIFVLGRLQGRFDGQFEDFRAYYDAGAALNAGHDPYAVFVHQTPNVALTGFDYPPVIAWLCRPLALLPFHVAATLWLWLAIVTTLAATVIVARCLLPATWPRVEIALLATFAYAPALYNFWHGQMNPVVFLLLALALRAYVSGHETECGAWLGMGAAVKLAPAVLVILLLRRHWWRGTLVAMVTGAATLLAGVVVVGFGAFETWVRDVLPVLTRGNGWLYNQSWSGVVHRVADHGVLNVAPDLVGLRLASTLLSVAGVVAVVWAVDRRATRPEVRGAEFGAGLVAMLLAGTITWYAHYVDLVVPLVAALALLRLPFERGRRSLVAAAVAALVVTGIVARLLINYADMPGIVRASHTAYWWPLIQLCSAPALSAGLLLAALVVVLRALHPDRPARPLP